MIQYLSWIGLFVISLTVLIKSSDWFTQSAEKIGHGVGIPPFIIGVTIVAIGTSLPELISSIFAVHMGASEIAVGNVLGSNITNILLIFGFTAVFSRQIHLKYDLSIVDLPLLLGSTLLLALMLWDGEFSKLEAVLCLSGMLVYLLYAAQTGLKEERIEHNKARIGFCSWIVLSVSAIGVYFGARFTVDAIIRLSDTLKVGREIIAGSAVALGTSLPELSVSISAARKGNPEMAIGNIVGSNIFNAFGVMSLSSFFGNVLIPQVMIRNALPILLIATFLFQFITQEKRITRWEGALLLIFYVFYLNQLFLS